MAHSIRPIPKGKKGISKIPAKKKPEGLVRRRARKTKEAIKAQSAGMRYDFNIRD